MQNLLIRNALVSDTDAIRALTLEGAPGVMPFEPNELEWAFEHSRCFWVATVDDRVVGYVLTLESNVPYEGEEFQWFHNHIDTFLYIDRVAVFPDARRQGVGHALYARVIRFAREHGNVRVACEVNLEPPNPESMAFHKKQSFVTLSSLVTHNGRKVALLVRNERAL